MLEEHPVSREELPEWCQFQASLSNHPIVLVESGGRLGDHYRYKETIAEHGDLNDLWREYHAGKYTRNWMMQFYRDIGYSLNGYEEVWGGELEEMQRRLSYETPIEQLEAKHVDVNLAAALNELAKKWIVQEAVEELDIKHVIELLRVAAHKLESKIPSH